MFAIKGFVILATVAGVLGSPTPERRCGSFVAYSPSTGVLGCGYAEGAKSDKALSKEASQEAMSNCGHSDCILKPGVCIDMGYPNRPPWDWYVAASKSDPSIYVDVKGRHMDQHYVDMTLNKCAKKADDCQIVDCANTE